MTRLAIAFFFAFSLVSFTDTADARGGGGGGRGAAFSHSPSSHHSVKGYVRDNGTYVAPHHATNPNKTRIDNWTTKGNVNPFTGVPGTKPLDISPAAHQ